MPWIEAALATFNTALQPANRERLDPELFAPGRPVKDAFLGSGVHDDSRIWKALELWPRSVAEAFKAALHSALTRKTGGPITVSWIASYDYGLEVYESQSFDDSPGGLTIIVRSRYPFDRHPASRRAAARRE